MEQHLIKSVPDEEQLKQLFGSHNISVVVIKAMNNMTSVHDLTLLLKCL